MDSLTSHFVRLATTTHSPFKRDEPIPVTNELLASILCCTPRNVKFILRKLEEHALIRWMPGGGRGHTSQLTFLRSVEEVLYDSFQALLSKGKMKEAIDVIGVAEVNEPLKERLLTELNKQMGLRSEAHSPSGLDILRIMHNRRMAKLDPAFVHTAFEAHLLGQICSTLVTYDATSGDFLPGLAHTWETNESHTSYIFYLRKGVRFHHGRTMTARDVKETLQRLKDLHSPMLCHYQDIERVELDGDYQVGIYLSRPNLFFLHLLSCIQMSILPFDAPLSHGLIGTGPFRLADLNENVLVLAAFNDYYGIRPLLDRVEIWYLPAHNSNERQYQLPNSEQMNLPLHGSSNNKIDYPASGCRHMMFNFRKSGIHHHLAFRQAVRLLYHPFTLTKELGGNRITPADSFLPWKSSQKSWEDPSLEHAKELLLASGYHGEPVCLAFRSKREDLEEAEWFQKRCAAIGLNINLQPLPEFNMESEMNADLIILEEILEDDWQWGMIHFFKNPSNYLNNLLNENQKSWLDRELYDFYQLPLDERIQLLDKVEGILRDNYWVLHGCHMNKRAQLNQSLFGLHPGSFGFMDISKLWIKPEVQF